MTSTDDSLGRAVRAALEGRTDALYKLLIRGSGLPGTRENTALALVFADETARGGASGLKLAVTMTSLDADEAPGGSPLEFLSVCGVHALGAYGEREEASRPEVLNALQSAAEDVRFRVRAAVPLSLARIGRRSGDPLVKDVAPWMDGYFQAAAVCKALINKEWLGRLTDGYEVATRIDEAFYLAANAPRAAWRYPGHKELVLMLASAPKELALRFGVPIFERLTAWSDTKESELRDAIEQNLRGSAIVGRYSDEVARVRARLGETKAPLRDPRHYVGPTRGRGKKRTR